MFPSVIIPNVKIPNWTTNLRKNPEFFYANPDSGIFRSGILRLGKFCGAKIFSNPSVYDAFKHSCLIKIGKAFSNANNTNYTWNGHSLNSLGTS